MHGFAKCEWARRFSKIFLNPRIVLKITRNLLKVFQCRTMTVSEKSRTAFLENSIPPFLFLDFEPNKAQPPLSPPKIKFFFAFFFFRANVIFWKTIFLRHKKACFTVENHLFFIQNAFSIQSFELISEKKKFLEKKF